MEKNTIGRFIAALRKANGLTQRELAEKLCVSDKAVSRWERDETYPDLTLIPAIAEIFGVTSDELLRGERSPAAPSAAYEERAALKTEKQVENRLRMHATAFRVQSIAACGIALAGVLAAAICNFAFLRAVLGFLVACGFYLAAAVCEVIFLVQAFSSLGPDFEGSAVDAYKKGLVQVGCRAFSLIAVLMGTSLPLIIFPYTMTSNSINGLEFFSVSWTNVGLTGITWPLFGTIFGAVVWGLAAAVTEAVKARLSGPLPEEIRQRRRQLLKKCAAVTAGFLAVTILAQVLLYANYEIYAPGRSFDNYEDFVDFMQTRTRPEYSYAQAPAPDSAIVPIEEDAQPQLGFPLQTLTNQDGEVLCQFRWFNRQVVYIQYPDNETMLPIRVRTQADNERAIHLRGLVNTAFCALDVFELALGAAVYFLRRRKIQ